MLGWRNARPVGQNVGLVVATALLALVLGGWLWEVDLICSYPGWLVYLFVFFVVPVCWPDSRASAYESRVWYFSRCTAG